MAAPGGIIISSRIMAEGAGSMVGAFLGMPFMGLLSNGMALMGVAPYWQEVARGLNLLFAAPVSVWQRPIWK